MILRNRKVSKIALAMLEELEKHQDIKKMSTQKKKRRRCRGVAGRSQRDKWYIPHWLGKENFSSLNTQALNMLCVQRPMPFVKASAHMMLWDPTWMCELEDEASKILNK